MTTLHAARIYTGIQAQPVNKCCNPSQAFPRPGKYTTIVSCKNMRLEQMTMAQTLGQRHMHDLRLTYKHSLTYTVTVEWWLLHVVVHLSEYAEGGAQV